MENQRNFCPRTRALIVSHPDQHLEVFSAAAVDIHLARVCAGQTRHGDRLADEILQRMLPERYRELYRADMLRAVGSTQPLKASVLADSLYLQQCLDALNQVAREAADEPDDDLVTWTF